MRVHLICAALPPQLDGIGDYTAQLAAVLSRQVSVTVLTTRGQQHTPIAGAATRAVFSTTRPRSVWGIVEPVISDQPDWVILQYNPFSYGRWGLNLHLPAVLRRVRRQCPDTRIALMVHEPFVPLTGWKFLIESCWQRPQLWMLGQSADLVLFSIEPWARQFSAWWRGKQVLSLPVGSNIPMVHTSRAKERARLGIPEGTLVLGLFGTAHASRLLSLVRDAARSVQRACSDALVLYIGPHGLAVREALDDLPLLTEGPLPPEEVSRRFAAMDIYLVPLVDGVSTRRTSLMTGLQHGVATVGTRGPLTDPLLLEEDGRSLLLADAGCPEDFHRHVLCLSEDYCLREHFGLEGRRLYQQEFAWERLASRLLAALGMDCRTATTQPSARADRWHSTDA